MKTRLLCPQMTYWLYKKSKKEYLVCSIGSCLGLQEKFIYLDTNGGVYQTGHNSILIYFWKIKSTIYKYKV